jgi:hypothetical protein
MNDDTLMTAVREPFTAVHMDTPVEQIVRRGRAVRARRRILGLAGAAAVAAGATVAVAALLPAGHPAGAQLAAWTVARQANGTIYVTIRELRDAARLQSTLRADGVPASVTFDSQPNPSCREYPGKWDLSKSGIQMSSAPLHIFAIDPAALPRGAGVQIGGNLAFEYSIPGHPGMTYISPRLPAKSPVSGVVRVPVIGAGLVQASPQCTGLTSHRGG